MCVCFLLGVLTHVWEKAGGGSRRDRHTRGGCVWEAAVETAPCPSVVPCTHSVSARLSDCNLPLCFPAHPQDYRLSDIAALRRTCQAGGGVTVSTRTVGGRDAIFKAAVDAAVRRWGRV